jgi:signal transduction histidine kinase
MIDVGAPLSAALGQLVLERVGAGFRRHGQPPGWCHTLGVEAVLEAPLGQLTDLFPFLEVFLPGCEQAWQTDGERIDSESWTQVGADGEEIHLEATALRVAARPLLVITRNDRMFEQQQLVLQKARELSLAHVNLTRELERRDVLVHCIVHDLASPLHSILGTLSLMLEDPRTPPGPWVKNAFDAAIRQRHLIQDILEVFASEHGAMQSVPDDPDGSPELDRVLDEVTTELQPIARRRSLTVISPPPAGGGIRIVGEASRLHRVLGNLLHNALKHSPTGGTVTLGVQPQAGEVLVSIEDEGPGVPPEVVGHLFQKFGRGRGRSSGTGLGLYFCRITVERWGGAIGYDPRPGGGARFWMKLRTVEVPHGPPAAGR